MSETSTQCCDKERDAGPYFRDLSVWKILIFFVLGVVGFAQYEVSEVVRGAMADAYIAVTSFVAITLILFYGFERFFNVNVSDVLEKHESYQPVIAALLGALPGCGGAIIVMTQYVTGRLTFGGVVAVLTSTMGDAAFLLIAREPQTAVMVLSISVVVGALSGLLVDRTHGRDFMHYKFDRSRDEIAKNCHDLIDYKFWISGPWFMYLIPGIILGLANAFQIDANEWLGVFDELDPVGWVGFVGALFCFGLWAFLPEREFSMVNLAAHPACAKRIHMPTKIMFDTNFVTAWVIFAFLSFELLLFFTEFDLKSAFDTVKPFVPMIGILVGFIPGCGPQIVTTTLYLNGYIPLSAQLGNALSNDGDALFPALALAPKAAILATLYTAVPAVIVAYFYYFMFE